MSTVRALSVIAAAALGLSAGACGRSSPAARATAAAGEEARVVHVDDGDTFIASIGGRRETIRVIGIDTPEIAHEGKPGACYGDEAARFVRTALAGARVSLRRGREPVDRFGRTLAYVRVLDGPLAGGNLAESLVRRGFARAFAFAPNTDDAATIRDLERRARSARRGLWAACGFARAFPDDV